MRLVELLGSDVRGPDGRSLGRVRDVRLTDDPRADHRCRVVGLVVGGPAVGTRLGIDRGTVARPAVLRWLFERVDRGIGYLPWADVERLDGRTVRARRGLQALPPLERP